MKKKLHIPRKKSGKKSKMKIPFSPWHLAAYFAGGISAVLLMKYSPTFKVKVDNLVALP